MCQVVRLTRVRGNATFVGGYNEVLHLSKHAREHGKKTAGYFDTNAADMCLVRLRTKTQTSDLIPMNQCCVSSRVLSQPSFRSHDRKENHTVTESPQST